MIFPYRDISMINSSYALVWAAFSTLFPTVPSMPTQVPDLPHPKYISGPPSYILLPTIFSNLMLKFPSSMFSKLSNDMFQFCSRVFSNHALSYRSPLPEGPEVSREKYSGSSPNPVPKFF